MKKIEYNCGYEELLAISIMSDMTLEQKINLAKKGISFSKAGEMLGPVLEKSWTAELEWCNSDVDEQICRGHIFYGNEDYPASLAASSNPPFCIAYKGARPVGCEGNFEQAQSITIVGTRHADLEGRRASYLLALECAANDIVVYSGYASGIDQSAHLGASDYGWKTFAVMPCGLNHSYAYRERALAKKIYDSGGGFISQFLCNEEPYKWNFHYRNRILAQISDATVVVQAPKSSGALITVSDALDCGKDVFVHTAGTGHGHSREGSQMLVNDGAITISNIMDLSRHTFNAFHCTQTVSQIGFEDIQRYLKNNPSSQNIYRYNDKYYCFVDACE